MKAIKYIFLLGSIAMIAWSCSDSTSPEYNKGFASPPYANATKISLAANNSNQADNSSQADSLSQALNQLAKKILGFGGMFINQSGRFVIYLTQPSAQKAKAKAVLSNSKTVKGALARIRAHGGKFQSTSVANMVIKKGQYTFIQLRTWYHKISNIRAINGVYMIGIDQSKNKITAGVKNKAVKKEVIKKLLQLNIPKDATAIYQMTKPELY